MLNMIIYMWNISSDTFDGLLSVKYVFCYWRKLKDICILICTANLAAALAIML